MNNAFVYGFRISFRRLLKQRKYTLINVAGLAASMAAALLIFMYLMFETSYDTHHENHEVVYRVGTDVTLAGERTAIALNSTPLGSLMVEQRPEFVSFMRIFPANFFFRNLIYRYQDKSFEEDLVLAADSTFFDFFSFDILEGSAANALTEPFSIIVTQSMAHRYFGNNQAYGNMIEVEGAGSFKVTAVVSDPPPNSHLQFHGLFSISSLYHLDHLFYQSFQPGINWEMIQNDHDSRLIWLYVKTTPGYDPEEFSRNHWIDLYKSHIGNIHYFDEIKLIFQPLADIHLTSKLGYEMTNETGSVTMMSPELVRIFFITGIFLLVLASINYTNISISQFHSRGKEVAIKKIQGAGRTDLMVQFFCEALVISFTALFLALFILEITLPSVNNMMGTPLTLDIRENKQLLLIFTGIALFTGLLSGAYPAIYFSRFSVLKVLSVRFTAGKGSLGLKKILITLQFVVSVFMIIATIVVARQLAYINNKDLGFNKERILVVELKDQISRQSALSLKNRFLQSPHFTGAALSNYYPSRLTFTNLIQVEKEEITINYSVNIVQADAHYKAFMEMELTEGRFFDDSNMADYHNAVVINQTAQRLFGWDESIGKSLQMEYCWPDGTQTDERKVIGVLKDFHFTSIDRPIEPLVFYPMTHEAQYLNLKFRDEEAEAAINTLETIWEETRPSYPLRYNFLDQTIAGMYHSQRILSSFFGAFGLLSIFIAFLGLYGLSAYSVEQRTREIGIRKVLGASTQNIITTIAGEFTWLIILASAIASSLAWYFMSDWLNSFAYHVDLTFLPFLTGIASAFLVAILAIFIHALQAAKLNPAKAVKYE